MKISKSECKEYRERAKGLRGDGGIRRIHSEDQGQSRLLKRSEFPC
jgi:hypothetical protein